MHLGVPQLVEQHVLIATPIHVQFNLVMVAKLVIWVIVDSCMKNTNLGLMLINLVVLSLGLHLLHLLESLILDWTKDLNTIFGKDPSKKKPASKRHKEGEPLVIFKRRSILFNLPYWKDLMLRHNFDFMHIYRKKCE
jgi:hypothetical protein